MWSGRQGLEPVHPAWKPAFYQLNYSRLRVSCNSIKRARRAFLELRSWHLTDLLLQ